MTVSKVADTYSRWLQRFKSDTCFYQWLETVAHFVFGALLQFRGPSRDHWAPYGVGGSQTPRMYEVSAFTRVYGRDEQFDALELDRLFKPGVIARGDRKL